MMMAFGHSASGWCTALMLVNALSFFHTLPAIALLLLALGCATAMAGAAILCDIDHIAATITTAFGPFSLLAHKLVIELHYTVAAVTADAGNRTPPGPHRGVTHWWPFPLASGGLIALGAWLSHWFMFAVLIVLFTGALRALTVPDNQTRRSDTVRRRWSMQAAHGIIDIIPVAWPVLLIAGWFGALYISRWLLFAAIVIVIGGAAMWGLKKAHHFGRSTYRIGTYWIHYMVPIGKIGTVIMAAGLALIAIRFPLVTENGAWLGALVCIGMYLHILGDAPTERGVPGFRLHRVWRLPKWLAFRAGGPFEIVCCWLPMTALGIYLIPGLRPREEVLVVQGWIVWGLGTLAVSAVVIEIASRYLRKRALIA